MDEEVARKIMADAVRAGPSARPVQDTNLQKIIDYIVTDSIPAQAVKSAWSGLTFPGDVYAGNASPYDYGRVLDTAGLAMTGGLAAPVSSGELRSGLGIPRGIAESVEDFGKSLGASVSISPRSDGTLILNKIVVPKESRGSGVGSLVMNKLISEADNAGATLALTPSSDFGGSKPRLIEFYKRFGFEPNSGKNRDFGFSETMRRYPNLKPGEI